MDTIHMCIPWLTLFIGSKVVDLEGMDTRDSPRYNASNTDVVCFFAASWAADSFIWRDLWGSGYFCMFSNSRVLALYQLAKSVPLAI